MASLFGFEFKKRVAEEEPASFAPPVNDDGAVTVAAGGSYGTFVDLEGTARTEAELVTRYRDMSIVADVERAVDEIVNECIVSEIKDQIVQINLDKLQYPDNIKQLIAVEFENIKSLLNFENQAYEIFRKWYVDGRLYYHVIIDDANPRLGIKEIRNIDPRKIRKVREQKKKRDPKSSAMIIQNQKEYFMYNEKGYNAQGIGSGHAAYSASGVKIAKDSIVHCVSGLMDTNGTMVLSYLHKAIKPLNQLRVLEDATVIYRISRAPERRIFYIDVGNLPKMKAEQYLRDMMVRHKNRLVYDATTGEVRDDRKFMTMLEDYWLPRREGGKGTEITTLPAGENLGKMEDVEYFQKKLFQSLNVPVTRLQTDQIYSIGKATEITRDEVKFSKFINRLRNRFSVIFLKCLEKQLVLKGIVTTEDWKVLSQSINFEFASDEYYQELKDTEMYMSRVNAANGLAPYIGKYYSHAWVRKNIFKQSMEDMTEQDAGIVGEYKNQVLYPPAPEQPQQ